MADERAPWLAEAVCRGVPGEVFFGTPGRSNHYAALEDRETRRTFCAHCPVAAHCRAEALEVEASAEYRYGVRGNMSAKDRERYWAAYRQSQALDAAASRGLPVRVAGVAA